MGALRDGIMGPKGAPNDVFRWKPVQNGFFTGFHLHDMTFFKVISPFDDIPETKSKGRKTVMALRGTQGLLEGPQTAPNALLDGKLCKMPFSQAFVSLV